MNESSDVCLQNLVNSSRKSATNEKTKSAKKDLSLRHRLSDQKWRQNVSNGFQALKTIVKQNRSVGQLIDTEGTKEVTVSNKPSMANKRLSRIETLKSTIDLVKTKESVIENIINEKNQELMDSSAKEESPKEYKNGKQSVTFNGLQKIKDIFDFFEKKHQIEFKEVSMKSKNIENSDKKKKSCVDNDDCLLTTEPKTVDPLLETVQPLKTEDFVEGIGTELKNQNFETFDTTEAVTEEWHPLILTKIESDSGLDMNNNNPKPVFYDTFGHSLDTFGDSPLLDSLTTLDNKSFSEYSYNFDLKDYLTTDLTEHLALTMPLPSFGSSFTYMSDTYV